MRVCVLGLCHLGSVTAACLAALGHRVVGIDFDESRVADLSKGVAPIFEPGLEELIKGGLASGNLHFSSTINEARDIDVLWVACDTPVDDDDNADTDFVMAQIERALLGMSADVVVLVSSQLPVGSIRCLEQSAALNRKGRPPRIAYCPENLRLGNAVPDFLRPNRIVVGVRSTRDHELLHSLLSPITESIEWMSVESAEMTKHAINAFLATSVVFANEIAAICESVGADAKEVERGLKTENRIGPRAYLSPGAAFAGGTLARDIVFLNRTARERGVITPLLSSVLPSNNVHKHWVQRKLRALFADLSRTTVAVWGLSYKPGTGSVRRSLSVDLCDWMIREGATIHVHDPMVASLPDRWRGAIKRFDTPLAAVHGTDALVVATDWPMYRSISSEQLIQCSDQLVVLDPNRFLAELAATQTRLQYFGVGMSRKDP
ncbi:MAG: nucleotide sugar dehydrogenase [Steroidobacteraceae bacterium]